MTDVIGEMLNDTSKDMRYKRIFIYDIDPCEYNMYPMQELVALIAPKGCIEQTLTAIVAVEFNEAVGVAVNGAEPATVAHILSPVVVVAVFTICAVVVVVPKGVGMKLQTRHQREQHYKHQQDADDATSCLRFCHTIISSLKIILKICLCVLCCLI